MGACRTSRCGFAEEGSAYRPGAGGTYGVPPDRLVDPGMPLLGEPLTGPLAPDGNDAPDPGGPTTVVTPVNPPV